MLVLPKGGAAHLQTPGLGLQCLSKLAANPSQLLSSAACHCHGHFHQSRWLKLSGHSTFSGGGCLHDWSTESAKEVTELKMVLLFQKPFM